MNSEHSAAKRELSFALVLSLVAYSGMGVVWRSTHLMGAVAAQQAESNVLTYSYALLGYTLGVGALMILAGLGFVIPAFLARRGRAKERTGSV